MKKNLVIGTLLISTIISAAAPAMADKSVGGTLIGGALGAVFGSQFGKGNGNKAAIAVGAIVGAIVGHNVGESLDQADRRAYEEAQRNCFDGDLGTREWRGRGARGNFRTIEEGYRGTQTCRSYESIIDYGNRVERTSGVACRDNRGFWQNVEEKQVDFRPRGNGGNYGGHGRDRRDDYRPAPRGGSDRTVVSNLRAGGQWVYLNLNRPVDVSYVEVRGLRGEVRTTSARVYARRGNFDIRAGGSVIDIRRQDVSGIDVWVEARWDGTMAEFTVYSDSDVPFVNASRR